MYGANKKQTKNSMCMRNRYVIAHFAFSRQNYRFIAGNFTQPLLPASSYLRRYLGLHTRFGQFTSARNLNSQHLWTDDNVPTKGQLISKAIYVVLDSPKKRTKKI